MKPEVARKKFWARVDTESTPQLTGCWPWQGATVDGEGMLTWEGIRQYAPRVAWKLIRGRLPGYLELKRTCSTESCVRPQHHYTRCRAHRIPHCGQCAGTYRAQLLIKLLEKIHGQHSTLQQ